MIALFTELVSKDKAKVTVTHFKPELLTVTQKSKAIMVETKPEAVQIRGKTATLYINPITKEMWYEYTDRPLSQEELLQDISDKLTELIGLTRSK